MEYTLKQARADFDYIVESLKIVLGNASLRGETTIDQAIVAAAIKAEKARNNCDLWTRDSEEKS